MYTLIYLLTLLSTFDFQAQNCAVSIQCDTPITEQPEPLPVPPVVEIPTPQAETPPIPSSQSCTMITPRICQVQRGSSFAFHPANVTGQGWELDIAPPWVSVSDTGEISGTAPANAPTEAHYVTLRKGHGSSGEYQTVIIITGNQRVVFVGPDEPLKSLQEYVGHTGNHEAQPGDVVMLRTGVYPYATNRLQNIGSGGWRWSEMSGTASARTTLIAEHPFQAQFDEIKVEPNPPNAGNPSPLHVQHVAFKGLNVKGSFMLNGRVMQGTHDIVAQQLSVGSISVNNTARALFEDVYALSGGRALFFVQDNSEDILFRRCVGRQGYMDTQQPGAAVLLYGRSENRPNNIVFQNCLILDRGVEQNFETSNAFYGAFETISADGLHIIDSVVANMRLSRVSGETRRISYRVMNNKNRSTNITVDGTVFDNDGDFRGNTIINGVTHNVGYNSGSYLADNPSTVLPTKRRGVTGTMIGDPGYDTLTSESLMPFPNDGIIQQLARAVKIEAGDLAGYPNISMDGEYGFAVAPSLTSYIESSVRD